MQRVELLDKLNLIKPCLANNIVIPSFSNIRFTKLSVEAFNGTQGMITQFETGISNVCVKGDFLIKLLSSYNADEIDISVIDNILLLKCGKSKVKINLFPVEDFVTPFGKEWVSDTNILELKIDKLFTEGIKKCLSSVNRNGIQEEQTGITLRLTKMGGFLYSTDNLRISRYKFTDTKFKKEIELMLPELFCKQLLTLCGDKETILNIRDSEVFIKVDDAVLMSTINTELELLDFDKVINSLGIEKISPQLVLEEFKEIVERGLIISSVDKDKEIFMETKDNFLSINVNSSLSELSESIEMEKFTDDFVFKTDIEKLNSSLKEISHFGFIKHHRDNFEQDTLFVGSNSDNFIVIIACI